MISSLTYILRTAAGEAQILTILRTAAGEAQILTSMPPVFTAYHAAADRLYSTTWRARALGAAVHKQQCSSRC